MDTLDNIVSKKIKNQINFLNLTTNGAESNILKGAKRLLTKNPDIKIGFPLGNISISGLEMLKKLKRQYLLYSKLLSYLLLFHQKKRID